MHTHSDTSGHHHSAGASERRIGLAREQLEAQQDLKVTLDHRDVLAELVKNRLNNANLSTVFPDYVPTMRGVTK